MYICHKGHPREDVKQRCKICKAENAKKWRDNNKDKVKNIAEIYLANEENRIKRNLKSKEWREANPEKTKKYVKTFNASGKRAAVTAKRRASKKQATPEWADTKAIREFYIQAKNRELDFGIKYEVDHIVPLQGDTFCGLHVEYNLQILPRKENRMKSNTLDA